MLSHVATAWLPKARTWLMALLTLMLASVAVHAAAEPQYPAQNNTRVVDDAGILSPAVEADLNLKLKGLEDKTTDQVVVVTVKDLQGYPIEDYGYQLGRRWGIGQKGQVQASNGQTYKDNGVLLIVAPNDRRVRIEVGYGLEPVLPDILAGRIVRDVILPEFKAGNMEAGIVSGADVIIQQLSMERGVAIEKAQAAVQQAKSGDKGNFPLPVIIFIIILIFMFSRGWLPWFLLGNILGGGGGWGSGGGGGWSGGGGFSGGGGSFGGGGASGSW